MAFVRSTFDMNGDRRQAQPAGYRPLDGVVRLHSSERNKGYVVHLVLRNESIGPRNNFGIDVLD